MGYSKSKVSVIIACKNEGEGIGSILKSVEPYSNDIIVVDGHSNDGTKEKVKKIGARFFLDNRKGRGDALKIGVKKARGDILVFFDADGSHEANDIPALIKPIINGDTDMTLGSRRTGGSFDVNLTYTGVLRSAGADFLVSLVNHRFNTKLTDILYSFRAIKTSIAKRINLKFDDFRVEQEMVINCLKKGFRIAEIPSREKARAWGESKLHTLMGIKFLFTLLKDLYLTK